MDGKLDYNEVYRFMQDFGIDALNRFNELIIDVPTNTYATIEECEDVEDVRMRVVFNLCRPIGKGLEKEQANMLLRKLNNYFKTELTRENLRLMYGELCYRSKFEEFKCFIRRGFPIEELQSNQQYD